jgi:DNA-binding CsgD family transcriptional regulator
MNFVVESHRAGRDLAVADRGFQPDRHALALWFALSEDSGAACLLADGGGLLVSVNGFARALFRADHREYAGRPLAELIGPVAAGERLAVIAELVAANRAGSIDGMVRGRFVRMTVRPLGRRGQTAQVLIVCRPAAFYAGPPRDSAGVRRASTDDLGALGSLTAKELDILTLMGQGLSTPRIAERLSRSVKTIEWHRVSLGEKLGAINRVELARIAIDAGLVMSAPADPPVAAPSPA